MAATGAKDYLETHYHRHSLSNPEVAAYYKDMLDLYERRLWHNVTAKLMELVQHPQVRDGPELIQLYENFIKTFETKINQLHYAHLIINISKGYRDVTEAIRFLETISAKVGALEDYPDPYLLLQSYVVQLKLKDPSKLEECKETLEKLANYLEGATGIDTSVYSNYYRARSIYHKLAGHSAEFYKNALQFLSYTPLEHLSAEEKVGLAFDLGLAALVGEDIYNFGDLLAHPIINSLEGTSEEWLAHLLRAFNAGDIQKYDALVAQYERQLSSQPLLLESSELLKEKISILCLIELVFGSHDRSIPFSLISQTTKLPLDVVELLVMKALSLKLIKGKIDQVGQVVNVTWVQPRVLGLEQIAKMRDRLDDWAKRVNTTLNFVEQGTPELFS
jgi:26S proteasome regulatory subunit N9